MPNLPDLPYEIRSQIFTAVFLSEFNRGERKRLRLPFLILANKQVATEYIDVCHVFTSLDSIR